MSDYNGWTNYETWCAKLWMDNDRGSYDYWLERTREVLADAEPTQVWTKQDAARIRLEQELKEWHDEHRPDGDSPLSGPSSVYTDLLGAALSEVNWREIAESMLSGMAAEEVAS